MKNTNVGIAHFMSAFKYSMAGLRIAVAETAVRHELYLGIVHFFALYILNVDWLYCVILSSLWGVVVIVEILNTAVEAVVDLVSPDFNVLAGRAKDLGSAAVFLALTLFVCAWLMVVLKSLAV